MDLPAVVQINFVHPSTFIVSGPTGCGKTKFVSRVLREQMIRDEDGLVPERIIWFFGAEQPALFDELRTGISPLVKLEFQEGLDNADAILSTLDPKVRSVVVIDDLMQEAKDDKAVAKLFTVDSHHANTSVIYLVQNLFPKGSQSTTISRNVHYFVLFSNPRNTADVRTLATQMLAGQGWGTSGSGVRAFMGLFNEVTEDQPYSYLLVDLRPETWQDYRYRTDIFPGETTRLFTWRERRSRRKPKTAPAKPPYSTVPEPVNGELRIGPSTS